MITHIQENPYLIEKDYLKEVVCADEYRFELIRQTHKDRRGQEIHSSLPTLRCYSHGRRTDVFIEIEYKKGIEAYETLPLKAGSLELLAAWFAMQDTQLF